jgi:hypothetical protein
MFDEAAVFDHKLEGARELLEEFESATDGELGLRCLVVVQN